jgi:hypothetical protein
MALTLEDLMNFMKKDKEERAVERETDKDELKQLISRGVKDEVEAVIGPMKDKQEQLEQVQSDMQRGFSEVMAEVKDIRKQLANTRVESHVSTSSSSGQLPSYSQAAPAVPTHHESVDDKLNEIISLGRRTVGLSRIDHEDLVRMRQEPFGGAQSEEEERLLAVREFLKCEMKLDSDAKEQMEIERIFPPARKPNPQYLYVTFKNERSVSMTSQNSSIIDMMILLG